jgi:hypothetical protein
MTSEHLIEAMRDPAFYPHGPDAVELIQTHISMIFIAGQFVYKVKKAVDFGFLDFTTLGKRLFFCNEELRLNRRLAPQIYLDVVPIYRDDCGRIRLGAEGRIIEYAVKMRRIPADRMLKKLIAEGKVAPSVMKAVAEKVARFHSEAATGGEIDRIGGADTVRKNVEENFSQTESAIGRTIPEARYRFLKSYALGFLQKRRSFLDKRVSGGRIRDCHGDLHVDHICLAEELIIFDCIEFNERFRYEDVAAEVAFLAMDLDYSGHADFGEVFVKSYFAATGDDGVLFLLNFYKCYYAYVRGKVTGFRLDDPAIPEDEKHGAATSASRYFELAYGYACRLEKPTLILTAGLMGTGKSVLARAISPFLGAKVIRSDVLRKELLRIDPAERHPEKFGEGIYADSVSRRTYEGAFRRAARLLSMGTSVVIDASFRKREDRLKAMKTAATAGADFFVLECVCPEETAKTRLERRSFNHEEASDGRAEIFAEQRRAFETIDEMPAGAHFVVDTAAPPEDCAAAAIERIRLGSR